MSIPNREELKLRNERWKLLTPKQQAKRCREIAHGYLSAEHEKKKILAQAHKLERMA